MHLTRYDHSLKWSVIYSTSMTLANFADMHVQSTYFCSKQNQAPVGRISFHCALSAGQCDMDLKAEAIGQGRVQGPQHSTYTGDRCTLQCNYNRMCIRGPSSTFPLHALELLSRSTSVNLVSSPMDSTLQCHG